MGGASSRGGAAALGEHLAGGAGEEAEALPGPRRKKGTLVRPKDWWIYVLVSIPRHGRNGWGFARKKK